MRYCLCAKLEKHPRDTLCVCGCVCVCVCVCMCVCVCVCQFSGETNSFHFFSSNLRKIDLGLKIRKINNGIGISILEILCTNVQAKKTTLTQILPKMSLRFEIRKTNVGIRINILEILCVPIFRQNEQFWIFWPKFASK